LEAIDDALETIWRLKRELKAEIATKKADSWLKVKEHVRAA
jgi:hypothetical protein